MDSKILRSSQVAFVLVISLLFWASCAPPKPVKPWDSKFLNKIQLGFTDIDTDPNEIGGDVHLNLNRAPQPNEITQYVLYWGGTASSSGKGDKIAEVPVELSGNLLYTISEDTSIPNSKNRYFLLFLKKADGSESYSGISTPVTDETQTAEEKEEARMEAEKAKEEARVEAEKAETARIEAEKVAAAEEAERMKEMEVEKQKEMKAERLNELRVLKEQGKLGAAEAAELAELEQEDRAEKAKAANIAAQETIVIENVLFDFDRSSLKREFKRKLRNSFSGVENVDLLKVVISGHADERGSNEYNLALGERRAFAVKRYLITLGLAEENISIISYGEEKPVDPRHTETAWEMNRRSETDFRD